MKHKKMYEIFVYSLSGLLFAFFLGIIFFHVFLPSGIPNVPTFQKPTSQTDLASSHSLSSVISNQWYSSVFAAFPSQPLYALPLVFKISQKGLGFSYPDVVKKENSIFAEYSEDFTVGYENDLNKPEVTSVGDWNIGMKAKTDANEELSFNIGHGMPFTVIHTTGKSLVISFPNSFHMFDTNQQELLTKTISVNAIRVVIKNNNYIFVFPKKININITTGKILIDTPQRIFIGLLDKKEHFTDFQKMANIEISDTQVSPNITDNKLITNYQMSTNGTTPLIALYPHQYDFLQSKQDILGTYTSIRGPLQLIKTSAFTTSMPLTIPPGSFTKPSHDYPDLVAQIKTDITAVMHAGPPQSQDYYLGTWFGKVDNLLLLADTYGLDKEKNQLLQYAEPLFLKSLDNFSYDEKKTSYIAKNPEFGNEKLNDHHFHYGYYIRTGAVLTSIDLSFLPKITEKIHPMIQDIATLERDNTTYPFLRNMDVYEGHSWADGFANFADGNNQESSSEAMNAWYGLYLWSKVTNDKNLENYSLYLYNTEITGALYYWFNTNNKLYTSPYKHAIASIVWGGKVDFATWFSNDTNMKYGIQLLPFTPASQYLGTLGSFTKYAADYVGNDGSVIKPWGDLYAMWKSFYNPLEIFKLKNDIKQFENDNPKSLFLYTLYANMENAPTPTPVQ